MSTTLRKFITASLESEAEAAAAAAPAEETPAEPAADVEPAPAADTETEVVEAAQAVEETLGDINTVEEAAVTIEAIVLSLEAYVNEGIDRSAAALIHENATMAMVRAGFNEIKLPSLECYAVNGKLAARISMEELKDDLKKIAEKIWETFKKVLAALKAFFEKITRSYVLLEKQVEELVQKAKDTYHNPKGDKVKVKAFGKAKYLRIGKGFAKDAHPLAEFAAFTKDMRDYSKVQLNAIDYITKIEEEASKATSRDGVLAAISKLGSFHLSAPAGFTKAEAIDHNSETWASKKFVGNISFHLNIEQPHNIEEGKIGRSQGLFQLTQVQELANSDGDDSTENMYLEPLSLADYSLILANVHQMRQFLSDDEAQIKELEAKEAEYEKIINSQTVAAVKEFSELMKYTSRTRLAYMHAQHVVALAAWNVTQAYKQWGEATLDSMQIEHTEAAEAPAPAAA